MILKHRDIAPEVTRHLDIVKAKSGSNFCPAFVRHSRDEGR